MGREIQHECDWHFCMGLLLDLTNRKDLKANTELKAIPDLNRDYDLKNLFKNI